MRIRFPFTVLPHHKTALAFLLAFGIPLPLLFPSAALAQRGGSARVRPAFEPKLVKRMTVSGILHLKVVPRRDGLPHEFAPIGVGGWAAVVRVDGHVLASLKRLPAIVNWNTRAAGDGVHEILVTIRNAGSDQEVGIEGAQVIVDNAAADTAFETSRNGSRAPQQSALPPLSVSDENTKAPLLTLPDAAKITTLPARLSVSRDMLALRATALLRSGSRLYLGLPNGTIGFCSADAPKAVTTPPPPRGGSVVRLPAGKGEAAAAAAVRSLAADDNSVWWTTDEGRAVYRYCPSASTVTRYDVAATRALDPAEAGRAVSKPVGWVRRVALLQEKVLLLSDTGIARLLNPRSGALTDADAAAPGLLPENALKGVYPGDTPHLYIAAGSHASSGADDLVISVTPAAPVPETAGENPEGTATLFPFTKNDGAAAVPRWRHCLLRAWKRVRADSSRDAWHLVAAFSTDADPARAAAPIALNPNAVATAEREGPRVLAATSSADAPRGYEIPYALSPGMPSSTDQIALDASGLWWEQRGIVFRADPRTKSRDAFLPWNIPGESGAVLALCADKNGVWVATTSAGVRRIQPGSPTARDGYNGYIRARLGSPTLRPPSSRAARIAGAIEAWQGVPYVWGGQSRSGTDCSGFVMRMHQVGGVSIPRTSAEMRRTTQGGRVRDELRWGDTLVYPGHCALYIGDGRTAETVGGTRDGGVSHSSVWVRSNVVVRRFLP